MAADFKFGGSEEDFARVELVLKGRKKRVAGGFEVHAGEEDFGAAREESGVEFSAADQVEIFSLGRGGDFFEGAKNSHARDFGLA